MVAQSKLSWRSLLSAVPTTNRDNVEVLPSQGLVRVHTDIVQSQAIVDGIRREIKEADDWLLGAQAEYEQFVAEKRGELRKAEQELEDSRHSWRQITQGLGIDVVWPEHDRTAVDRTDNHGRRDVDRSRGGGDDTGSHEDRER